MLERGRQKGREVSSTLWVQGRENGRREWTHVDDASERRGIVPRASMVSAMMSGFMTRVAVRDQRRRGEQAELNVPPFRYVRLDDHHHRSNIPSTQSKSVTFGVLKAQGMQADQHFCSSPAGRPFIARSSFLVQLHPLLPSSTAPPRPPRWPRKDAHPVLSAS